MNMILFIATIVAAVALSIAAGTAANALLRHKHSRDLRIIDEVLDSTGSQREKLVEQLADSACHGYIDEDMMAICENHGIALGGPAECTCFVPAWRYRQNVGFHVAIGAITGTAIAAAALLGGEATNRYAYVIWALIGCFGAGVMAICDVKARVIPWECCLVLALSGSAFWIIGGKLSDAGVNLAASAATYVALALLISVTKSRAFGQGDAMAAATMIAYFYPLQGVPKAFLGGAAVASLIALAALLALVATRKIDWKTTVPLAPAFFMWTLAGTTLTPL